VIYTEDQIAQVIHAANGALQEIHGETPLQPGWAHAPEAMRARVLSLVRGYRAGITARQAHERWLELMAADGWRYGPRKDPGARLHPNMVAFGDLPDDQRVKDLLSQQITLVLSGGGSW